MELVVLKLAEIDSLGAFFDGFELPVLLSVILKYACERLGVDHPLPSESERSLPVSLPLHHVTCILVPGSFYYLHAVSFKITVFVDISSKLIPCQALQDPSLGPAFHEFSL